MSNVTETEAILNSADLIFDAQACQDVQNLQRVGLVHQREAELCPAGL